MAIIAMASAGGTSGTWAAGSTGSSPAIHGEPRDVERQLSDHRVKTRRFLAAATIVCGKIVCLGYTLLHPVRRENVGGAQCSGREMQRVLKSIRWLSW